MKDLSTGVTDDEQDVENLESDRWHGKKIHGSKTVSVVAKERHPTLLSFGMDRASRHVSSNSAFGYIETEHQQLTVDAGRSPSWILYSHAPNKITNPAIDCWSTAALGT